MPDFSISVLVQLVVLKLLRSFAPVHEFSIASSFGWGQCDCYQQVACSRLGPVSVHNMNECKSMLKNFHDAWVLAEDLVHVFGHNKLVSITYLKLRSFCLQPPMNVCDAEHMARRRLDVLLFVSLLRVSEFEMCIWTQDAKKTLRRRFDVENRDAQRVLNSNRTLKVLVLHLFATNCIFLKTARLEHLQVAFL